MFQRRTCSVLAAAFATFLVTGAGVPAVAGEIIPVSMPAYQAAVATGKPLVFYVKADWCPVCAQETPIIKKLMEDPAFKDYTVLVVDFDQNKQVVQMLKATSQSTIIVNKGNNELGRAIGLTGEAEIKALLLKAS